jgi:hypothetical protein
MNRKMAINWHFLLLNLIFLGCQSRPVEPKFVRDIPKQKYQASTLLEGVRATKDSLGLDDLENGYDSLQIRMWFTYPLKDSEQVLTIKRNNAHWYGSFCLASYALTPMGDSISRYTIHFFKPILRRDWGDIVDTLIKFNIINLQDERQVANLDSIDLLAIPTTPTSGSVIIEIADQHKYKLYFYPMPVNYKEQLKEAADVCHMVEFLSNRLGIEYLGTY